MLHEIWIFELILYIPKVDDSVKRNNLVHVVHSDLEVLKLTQLVNNHSVVMKVLELYRKLFKIFCGFLRKVPFNNVREAVWHLKLSHENFPE